MSKYKVYRNSFTKELQIWRTNELISRIADSKVKENVDEKALLYTLRNMA